MTIPICGRTEKPRDKGVTMIIDKGLGPRQAQDLVEIAGDCIDFVKLGFGTSRFCDAKVVKKKLVAYRNGDINVMPGGTFLEAAVVQNVTKKFLAKAKELGFSAMEVSDGTIPMSDETRYGLIKEGRALGFEILSEVGSKFREKDLSAKEFVKRIKRDLDYGVFKVIVEAREAGHSVGIYNKEGDIVVKKLDTIIADMNPDNLMFEAPKKSQQLYFINRFGINANLGNVPPSDILALEALRCGLRADTLAKVIE